MGSDNRAATVAEYRRLMQLAHDSERKAEEILRTLFPEGATVKTSDGRDDTVTHATYRTVWCCDYGYLAEDLIRANYPEAG